MTVKSKVWNGADWVQLSGAGNKKIVAVDVFDGKYPAMTLTGGAYLDNATGMVRPAVTNNYAMARDSAALSITGDIDIMCRLKMDDWSPARQTFIVSKGSGGAAASYILGLSGSNSKTLQFFASPNGTSYSVSFVSSSLGVPFTDGAYGWIRATLDVNDGAGNYQLKFYTAADESNIPNSWTQLGVTRTGTATSIFDGTGELRMMENVPSSSSVLSRLIIKNGYDGAGTTVFDADFAVPAYGARSFTESSSNAATVSIVSTASWTAQWNVPAGATFVKVCCVGGGGGGGGGPRTSVGTTGSGGASGASGGVSFIELSSSAFASSVTVTIGSGGTAGSGATSNTDGGAGGAGGATTFGAFCGAGGGGGGAGGRRGANATAGAAPAGLYGVAGNTGTQGLVNRGLSTILVGSGGTGGPITSGGVLAADAGGVGVTGLIIGSDVPAVRNFASGSGGVGAITGTAQQGGVGQSGCGGGGGGAGLDPVNGANGGSGGDGFCVVVSYRDVNVQEFTASGTWNKPVGDFTLAKIFVVGGGGGGGSGATAASGVNADGSTGGGGGAITCITIPFSQLGNTETVTIGLGGTGGAGRTGNSEGINPGNNGGESSFGSHASARGGTAGTNSLSGASLGGVGFSFNGGGGGQGGTNGNGLGTNSYTGGGGGGGFLSSNNSTVGNAGTGGVGAVYTSAITAAAGGSVGTPNGSSGANASTVAGFYGGLGGGGGRGNFTANGGNGGNGSAKGGGGGGGAGARNGYTSGAGGNGGDGYVCVVCI